jgi:hypothetical protein
LTIDGTISIPGGASLTVSGFGTLDLSNSVSSSLSVTGTGIATLINDGTQPFTIPSAINVSGQATFDFGGSSVIDISGAINLGAQGNLVDQLF